MNVIVTLALDVPFFPISLFFKQYRGGVILRPVDWCQTMHLLCQTLCDSVSAPPVLSGLMPARSCMKLQTAPAQSMYSTEILGDSLSRQIKACYLTLLQYQLLHC